MKKYKLIKTYPGSPDLGTEVQEHNTKSGFYYDEHRMSVLRYHVENQPEYWEEVRSTYYLVFTKDESSFKAWQSYKSETTSFMRDDVNYFARKEDAEEFILYNKPCLSYGDICWNFTENTKKNTFSTDINILLELIKSKI
jgi:hypothetical protein